MKALLSFTTAIVATSKLGALSKVFHHKLTYFFLDIIPITEVVSRTPAMQLDPQQ